MEPLHSPLDLAPTPPSPSLFPSPETPFPSPFSPSLSPLSPSLAPSHAPHTPPPCPGGNHAKSDILTWISIIIGWVYFLAWSVSFYPQIILNWRRKSVIGLSFDFLALNLGGYICYSVFNLALKINPLIHNLYCEQHCTPCTIPVEWNDVFFALHGLLMTGITIIQCYIYERGDQRVSIPTIVIICLQWTSIAAYLVVTFLGLQNWLQFVTYLSYIKVSCSFIKYIPQAYFNCKRKSTSGWSIGNVLLDITGGILSFGQMFLDGINKDDWSGFTGNAAKLGLSILTIVFDLFFIIQHYVLYPPWKATGYKSLSEDDAINAVKVSHDLPKVELRRPEDVY